MNFASDNAAGVTWRAGGDVLAFGATKNGAMAAEAVIFFDPELAHEFVYRRKRGGHLLSKMRYVSAQLLAYITDDLWLVHGTHANAMAARLGAGLSEVPGARLVMPVQVNEVFVQLLDEVAELPMDLQAKLLRVLEDGEFYRLGETKVRHASARVLAATNKDIFSAIEKSLFREDLYHRLSVLTLRVPSLNDRGGDKLELLDYFKREVDEQIVTFQLDEEALGVWNNYNFPGNVRELRNIIIRLSAKYPGQTIKPEVLKLEMTGLQRSGGAKSNESWLKDALHAEGFQLDLMLKSVEKQMINIAMREQNGNVSKAADMLGVNRTTLYGRMDRV